MADKNATLHIEGKAPIELPIMDGTLGPEVIDVRKLGSNGYFTFDPGFLATASCESQITFIDGGKVYFYTEATQLISLLTMQIT